MKITLELRAAEGGEDSRLFATELAKSYMSLAAHKGWLAHCNAPLNQGHACVVLTIEGPQTQLSPVLNEGGGHRVQRVPPNERRGRVHSSTVTVAVLEEQALNPLYQQRAEQDFAVSFFSGSGPGGQNRNKVQACARIVHLPTGLVRTAQTRSRENSVRLALAALHADLDVMAEQHKREQGNQVRQAQVGAGMRGDKRRTYRSQDNRVTDHTTGKTARMSDVMKGRFEILWE